MTVWLLFQVNDDNDDLLGVFETKKKALDVAVTKNRIPPPLTLTLRVQGDTISGDYQKFYGLGAGWYTDFFVQSWEVQ